MATQNGEVSQAKDRIKERLVTWFQGSTLNGQKVSVQDLVAEIERQKATKKDYVVDSRALKMVAGNLRFTVPNGAAAEELSFQPSNHCDRQVSEKTGIPAKYYDRMRAEALPLLDLNVNEWLNRSEDPRLIRTLDGRARAMLSSRYRTLDNVDLFFNAAQVFKASKANIVRADLTENRFSIRAVVPSTEIEYAPGKTVAAGVSISNSETGMGSLNIDKWGIVLHCMNGMMSERVFDRLHIGEALQIGVYTSETLAATTKAVWLQARDQLTDALSKTSAEFFANRLASAMQVPIPVKVTELVTGTWEGIEISALEKTAIMEHLFGDNEGMTQYGFAQAITATGRDQLDADRRTALETIGMSVLSKKPEQFNELMATAAIQPRKVAA